MTLEEAIDEGQNDLNHVFGNKLSDAGTRPTFKGQETAPHLTTPFRSCSAVAGDTAGSPVRIENLG